MRSPEIVLSNLATKTKEKGYKFRNLYKNLYNPSFFLRAYSKIAPNPGNMTPGTDGETLDGMSIERFEKIINELKDESYQPKPVRRKYIEKKDKKSKRPLGIPSIEDKLVQEVLRSILESIFEPNFSENSHGFRPKRSCHTAIGQIYRTFRGVRWFVEGDIQGFFDNIDHHTLVNLLKKKIEDEKLIRLIWKFLRAGYLEDWQYHNTYSGTPQGGILSPLLANIYLNELDIFMDNIKDTYDKGKRKKANSLYDSVRGRAKYQRSKLTKIRVSICQEEFTQKVKEIKLLEQKLRQIPTQDEFDPNFRRLLYVRYADDFLVGIIGPKEDAIKIKEQIANHLHNDLKLELSEEKTLITHSERNARFLGYDISISRSKQVMKNAKGEKRRQVSYAVRLGVPTESLKKKLLNWKVMQIDQGGNWKPIARNSLRNYDAIEILNTVNAEIRGLYNYYKLAHEVYKMNHVHYVMEYSFYKTLASKFNTSKAKIMDRFRVNGKVAIQYRTKAGEKLGYFNERSYQRSEVESRDTSVDNAPHIWIFQSATSLTQRLLAGKCEACGIENQPVEVHHVRKLKDLKGKKRWEKHMIARKRKTLVMCLKCHDDLHAGRLD